MDTPLLRVRDARHIGQADEVHRLLRHFAGNLDSAAAGLTFGCRHGRRDIVDVAIENGATCWFSGLLGACEGGHLALAELMLTKRSYTDDEMQYAVFTACQHGHMNVMEMLQSKGAHHCAISNGGVIVQQDWKFDTYVEVLLFFRGMREKQYITEGTRNVARWDLTHALSPFLPRDICRKLTTYLW